MTVTRADFEYVQTLIYERAGIVLETGKEYLVESRLDPLAQKEGFNSLRDFLARLQGAPFNASHQKLIHAMTTNETLFFRDIRPFQLLRTRLIPDLMAAHATDRRITFWSAACSTGQEPYSVAMLLREYFPQLQGWNIRFIASDLSSDVLARAIRGCYSQVEVNCGLPAKFLIKYFTKQGDAWQIRDEIRRMIEFRELNLTETWSFSAQNRCHFHAQCPDLLQSGDQAKNSWQDCTIASPVWISFLGKRRNNTEYC